MGILANYFLIGKLAALIFMIGPFAVTCISQANADQWLRVFTDEDSITDVDRFSLVLEPDQMMRAEFRTTFTIPAPVPGKSGAGYKSRLDSIQFRFEGRYTYRVRDSRFLDSSGNVISSGSPADAEKWKPVAGRTATALFSAATQLRPFGIWKVVSYKYVSGDNPSKDEPRELKALLGSDVYLAHDRARIAERTCESPRLEPMVMTDEEFSRRVGVSLESLGMADDVDAIYLRCLGEKESAVSGKAPALRPLGGIIIGGPSREPLVNNSVPANFRSTTLILRRTDNRILILWDGVFLELERATNIFLPRSYQ